VNFGNNDSKIISNAPTEEKAKEERDDTSSHILSLHDGQFNLNTHEYPVIGKMDAAHIMLSLFDYTCHYCRETHEQISKLASTFPDDLAIISLPTPLNAECNPLMKRRGMPTPPAHRDACLLAAYSLAVFRSKPEAWVEYDQWLFTGKEAPSLAEAQSEATRIVGGSERLNPSLRDIWIRDTVYLAVDILDANMRLHGKSQMPQLIIGESLTSGVIHNADELIRIAKTQFGLTTDRIVH